MDGSVRVARPRDADDIADIHVSSWRVTYRGMLPDDYLDAMDRRRLAARWRRRTLVRSTERVLVALRGDVIAGFVCLTPSMSEPGFAGEITMLYVKPELERCGVGTQLLDAGLEQLAAKPLYWAIIWAVEANERAIQFYKRRGFCLDGGRRIDRIGGAPIAVVRCAMPLNPAIDYAALR